MAPIEKLCDFLRATDDTIAALQRLIKSLDIPGPSVFHSALIAATAKRRTFQAALDARRAELVTAE
jgi:hypothetical protein